jgi:hypothetical protein
LVWTPNLVVAARNLFWLPFRAVLTFFEWLTKILVAAVLVGLVGVLALGAYFYFVKSNQPMQIDPRYARSLPPEGLTFRELWQDRFAGWTKLEEQNYQSGKWKLRYACRLGVLYWFVPYQIVAPTLRIYYARFRPGTPMAEIAVHGFKGMIAPDNLNLIDALWWQFENETWYYWVEDPLCDLPPPKRPAQASP